MGKRVVEPGYCVQPTKWDSFLRALGKVMFVALIAVLGALLVLGMIGGISYLVSNKSSTDPQMQQMRYFDVAPAPEAGMCFKSNQAGYFYWSKCE